MKYFINIHILIEINTNNKIYTSKLNVKMLIYSTISQENQLRVCTLCKVYKDSFVVSISLCYS